MFNVGLCAVTQRNACQTQEDFESERRALLLERGKQARLETSINQQIESEAQVSGSADDTYVSGL